MTRQKTVVILDKIAQVLEAAGARLTPERVAEIAAARAKKKAERETTR